MVHAMMPFTIRSEALHHTTLLHSPYHTAAFTIPHRCIHHTTPLHSPYWMHDEASLCLLLVHAIRPYMAGTQGDVLHQVALRRQVVMHASLQLKRGFVFIALLLALMAFDRVVV